MTEHNKEELVDFRLSRLEEAVSSLSAVKDVVLKWDARFSVNDGFLQCPMHKIKMEEIEKRMGTVETSLEEMKKFIYKATGALVVISIVVQLAGPIVLEKLHIHTNPTTNQTQTTTKP